jgi:hypothetical protein
MLKITRAEDVLFAQRTAKWSLVTLKHVVVGFKSYVKKLTSGRGIRYLTGLIDVSSLIRSLSAGLLIAPNKVFRVAV